MMVQLMLILHHRFGVKKAGVVAEFVKLFKSKTTKPCPILKRPLITKGLFFADYKTQVRCNFF